MRAEIAGTNGFQIQAKITSGPVLSADPTIPDGR